MRPLKNSASPRLPAPRHRIRQAGETAARSILLALLALLLLLTPALLHAELLVLEIDVNSVKRGEFFVEKEASGNFLLAVADLPALGLLITPQRTTTISSTSYFSLRDFPDITAAFDLGQLTLSLTAPSRYFPPSILDLASQQQRQVLRPEDTSAFVNYRLDFASDSRISAKSGGASSEIGFRRRNLLLLSSQRFEKSGDASRFTRQMTSATSESREDLRRLIVGDTVAPNGLLDPSVLLAGVTFSRNFALDPAFIQYPTFDYAGSLLAPGELDIYQNGFKLRTEKLPPGPFQLENLSGAPGYGEIELVLRDQFGRETRRSSPYYLTDQLLKPGLQEYSYSVGLERQGYGSSEDRYTVPVLVASHRYGWKRQLTLGYSLQAGDGLLMIAPRLDLLAGNSGIVSLAAGGSTGKDGGGGTTLLRYSFNRRPFSSTLEYQYGSERWQTLAAPLTNAVSLQQSLRGTIGWGSLSAGSLTITAAQRTFYQGDPQRLLGTSYSRRLVDDLSCNLFLQQTRDSASVWTAFAILTYSPPNRPQTALRLEGEKGTARQAVDLQQNAPAGTGYGYFASAGHRRNENESAAYLEASGEDHRQNLNVWGRGYLENGDAGGASALSLAAAGALTWVGNHFELSRPVDDSFALVRVGTLPGVKVYRNGEEIGRTNAEGLVLIPGLTSYYDNRISLDDTDIPIDHLLNKVEYYLSPPARSGSCLDFHVVRSQPITGRLYLRQGEVLRPLEFRQLDIVNALGEKLTIPTGREGEFYFAPENFQPLAGAMPEMKGCENFIKAPETSSLPPSYQATLSVAGKERTIKLEVPVSDALFIDLGKIVVVAEEKP